MKTTIQGVGFVVSPKMGFEIYVGVPMHGRPCMRWGGLKDNVVVLKCRDPNIDPEIWSSTMKPPHYVGSCAGSKSEVPFVYSAS